MDRTKRIYQRTKAGDQALRATDSRLQQQSRTVLGFLGHACSLDESVEARLPRCSSAPILSRLEELEGAGLVESVAMEWLEELYSLGYYEPEPYAAASGKQATLR
jgi:hypothetical protein